jgi:hypothetical protein
MRCAANLRVVCGHLRSQDHQRLCAIAAQPGERQSCALALAANVGVVVVESVSDNAYHDAGGSLFKQSRYLHKVLVRQGLPSVLCIPARI